MDAGRQRRHGLAVGPPRRPGLVLLRPVPGIVVYQQTAFALGRSVQSGDDIPPLSLRHGSRQHGLCRNPYHARRGDPGPSRGRGVVLIRCGRTTIDGPACLFFGTRVDHRLLRFPMSHSQHYYSELLAIRNPQTGFSLSTTFLINYSLGSCFLSLGVSLWYIPLLLLALLISPIVVYHGGVVPGEGYHDSYPVVGLGAWVRGIGIEFLYSWAETRRRPSITEQGE